MKINVFWEGQKSQPYFLQSYSPLRVNVNLDVDAVGKIMRGWGLSEKALESLTLNFLFESRSLRRGGYYGRQGNEHFIALSHEHLLWHFPWNLAFVTVHELRHAYWNTIEPGSIESEDDFGGRKKFMARPVDELTLRREEIDCDVEAGKHESESVWKLGFRIVTGNRRLVVPPPVMDPKLVPEKIRENFHKHGANLAPNGVWRKASGVFCVGCGNEALINPYTNGIWGCETCEMAADFSLKYFQVWSSHVAPKIRNRK